MKTFFFVNNKGENKSDLSKNVFLSTRVSSYRFTEGK